MPRPSVRSLPALHVLLEHFETSQAESGQRDLERAIENRKLSRSSFYGEGMWAILVSGVSVAIAQGWLEKAERTGFPCASSDWQVLGDWRDAEFDAWCKSMARTLEAPQTDLSGKFRDKWWYIWDLGWYLAQFPSESAFRKHFFGGKTAGADLAEEDVRRLAEIKRVEWPRLGGIDVANRYFILRNLGGDFLKPDVWINAFCQWYGGIDVAELADMLRTQGIHCGQFDAYCWDYCEREIGRSRNLAKHFNAQFMNGEAPLEPSPGTTVSEVEESIWEVEHIRVVIRQEADAEAPLPYDYRRGATASDTVASWIDRRVRPLLDGQEVVVLKGDGGKAAGQAKLATVRNSYTG